MEVVTFVKSNLEKEERLKETGVSISVNDSLAIDVAVIDKSLIWYGSVNYLGYNTDENNAIRIYDWALYSASASSRSKVSFTRLNTYRHPSRFSRHCCNICNAGSVRGMT